MTNIYWQQLELESLPETSVVERVVRLVQQHVLSTVEPSVEAADSIDVPLMAMIPPAKVNNDGIIAARKKLSIVEQPALRLPTNLPITQTAWWPEHANGLYGCAAEILQQQRKFIANILDNNLRALGRGQRDEAGNTRSQAFEGTRRRNAIATLRKRLAEKLDWAWAEDVENVHQPDEDEEEWENFSDTEDDGQE